MLALGVPVLIEGGSDRELNSRDRLPVEEFAEMGSLGRDGPRLA